MHTDRSSITIEFLRQFRFGRYAIFDLVVAFLGMFVLSPLLSKIFLMFRIKIPKRNWLFLTLPISIVVHLLVGKITLMTQDFIDPQGHYVLKIFIIILFIFGMWGIKIAKKNGQVVG